MWTRQCLVFQSEAHLDSSKVSITGLCKLIKMNTLIFLSKKVASIGTTSSVPKAQVGVSKKDMTLLWV